MAKLVEGKIGLVTGASRGIGRACALAFAEEGSKVVVADILQEEGEETVRLIKDAGGEAVFFKCDVREEEQVKRMVDFTVSKYGRLDWAHNNAGILGASALLSDYPSEVFDDVIKTHVYGTFYGMKYEIKAMLKTGGGAIVNTSSDNGVTANAYCSAYGTAKWAILGLTKSAALDYGNVGIRANSIGPGVTDTPMIAELTRNDEAMGGSIMKNLISAIPLGHIAQPEDMAYAAVFLCSDKARHITADHLIIDGGQFVQL